MSRLEDLPEITDHVLSGLTAGEDLKYKIMNRTLRETPGSGIRSFLHSPVPVLCSAVAVMVLAVLLLNGSPAVPASSLPGEIRTFAAGSVKNTGDLPANDMDTVFTDELNVDLDRLASAEIPGLGNIEGIDACKELADLLRDAVPADPDSAPSEFSSVLILVSSDGNEKEIPLEGSFLKLDRIWYCNRLAGAFGQAVQP